MKFVEFFFLKKFSLYFLLRWLNIVSIRKLQGEDVNDLRYKRARNLSIIQYFWFHVMLDWRL